MELSNILLLLLSLIPFMYLCLHKLNKLRTQPRNMKDAGVFRLPLGSTGFPLIGETLSYYFRIRQGCQYEFVKERMDKFSSKIFRTSLIGEPVAILCNAEGNKFLFANENKLVKVWHTSKVDKLFPQTNNQPTGDNIKWLRDKIIPWIFKADVLRENLGVMDALMKQHLETYWSSKDVVNVGKMAGKYTLDLGCNFFLGINDPSKIDEVVQGMDEIEVSFFGTSPINLPGTALNRGINASKIMRSKIEAIIRQRRMGPSKQSSSSSSMKDLMSHMLAEVDENGEFLKEESIASYLAALMFTGYSTLHLTITLVMKHLSEHSSLYDSVLKEQQEIASSHGSRDRLSWEDIRKMKYSWNVVCEVLRIYSSEVAGFREVIADFTYEGYTIPKGWKIHWMSQATHMNPKYFDDPEKFDPSRFEGKGPAPYTFIPFGSGARMCPGNEFAKFATLTFLHYVVTMFRWEEVVPGEKVLKYPLPRPAQGLPVRLYPHKA